MWITGWFFLNNYRYPQIGSSDSNFMFPELLLSGKGAQVLKANRMQLFSYIQYNCNNLQV